MLGDSFPCDLVTWEEAARLARILGEAIRESGWRPDIVIAIGRGGYVPARVVCDILIHNMLTSMKIEHWGIAAKKKDEALVRVPLAIDIRDLAVLIVDDVTDTGETLAVAVEYVGGFSPREVRTAVLQHKYTSSVIPDYYADFIDRWRWIIYPWALHEDLVGFTEKVIGPRPLFFDDIRQALMRRFNIEVPDEMLESAIAHLIAEARVERFRSLYRRCPQEQEPPPR
jgi:hypoxanthine phosphoribosyltransferase